MIAGVALDLAELGEVLADAEAAPGTGGDDRAHIGLRCFTRRQAPPSENNVHGERLAKLLGSGAGCRRRQG